MKQLWKLHWHLHLCRPTDTHMKYTNKSLRKVWMGDGFYQSPCFGWLIRNTSVFSPQQSWAHVTPIIQWPSVRGLLTRSPRAMNLDVFWFQFQFQSSQQQLNGIRNITPCDIFVHIWFMVSVWIYLNTVCDPWKRHQITSKVGIVTFNSPGLWIAATVRDWCWQWNWELKYSTVGMETITLTTASGHVLLEKTKYHSIGRMAPYIFWL